MSDGQSRRADSAARPTTRVRVRERVKVRRRRSRKERSNALDAESWLAGAKSRRLRKFTLGLGSLVLVVIAVYLIFRR